MVIENILTSSEHLGGTQRYYNAMTALNEADFKPLEEDEFNETANNYALALRRGLSGEGSSLQMIPTLLRPTEFENLDIGDEALVVEIGGTNIRGAIVKVSQDGLPVIKSKEDSSGLCYCEENIERTEFTDADDFFSQVLSKINPILDGHKPKALAVIYSFSGKAIKTKSGIDVLSLEKMGKEFIIPGISKQPVGEKLLEKLRELNIFDREDVPLAVMNDTPAVLLSASRARIGSVVGTGFNLALSVRGNIYNTESGSFDGIPIHLVASKTDNESSRPGEQLAEKQISGMYLAPQLEYVIDALAKSGDLRVENAEKVTAELISDTLGIKKYPNQDGVRRYIKDPYSLAILSAIAGRLRHRSAQLVGLMLGTAMEVFHEGFSSERTVFIPIEGSVFWNVPGYKELVEQYMY